MAEFDIIAKKAIEEVEVKNINAVLEYSKGTRSISRDSQKQIEELKGMVVQQNNTIAELRVQVTNLMVRVGC